MILIAGTLLVAAALIAGALLWSLAVHALPLWCGGSTAVTVYAAGGGIFASLMTGLAAATATLVIGLRSIAAAPHRRRARLCPARRDRGISCGFGAVRRIGSRRSDQLHHCDNRSAVHRRCGLSRRASPAQPAPPDSAGRSISAGKSAF